MEEETNKPDEQETAPEMPNKEQVETLIDKANEASERQEKANADLKAQLDRQESIMAKNTLAGKAETTVKKKEESDTDYAKKVMANDIE